MEEDKWSGKLSILSVLRRETPDMPKKMAQAARYAMDHPDRMALDSMRTTAKAVGVNSTTMLRLARQLGFESYEDFRAGFQSEFIGGGFGDRAGALSQRAEGQGSGTLADKILHAAELNLQDMREGMKQEELTALAHLIREARQVYLVGSGSLYWLAAMMKTTGNMILPNLRLVGAENTVAAEAMGTLSAEDVVICFSMNPTAKRTIDAMRFAHSRGARKVAITDHPRSPLSEGAEFLFHANTESPHYYPSIAPLVLIVEAILATVVASGGDEELAQIRNVEATRNTSGHYQER